MFRYGLIPRVLDPDRPALATGTDINVYIGGTSDSAYTFLPLGTIYFLDAKSGIVFYYAGWALVGTALLRFGSGPGPARMIVFGLLMAGPLGWFSTYPDSMVGLLQGTVSITPIVWLVARSAKVGRADPEMPVLDVP